MWSLIRSGMHLLDASMQWLIVMGDFQIAELAFEVLAAIVVAEDGEACVVGRALELECDLLAIDRQCE